MLARRFTALVRLAPHIAFALQLAWLVIGDPATAASGGGDFPFRLR